MSWKYCIIPEFVIEITDCVQWFACYYEGHKDYLISKRCLFTELNNLEITNEQL